MSNDKRIFGLDALRSIAVLSVLIHHWAGGYLIFFGKTSIHQWTILGFYSVEMFFVLSGFLIGNIIIKTYLRETNYNTHVVKVFWIRRWYRTLPLYYAILLINIIIFFWKKIEIHNLWSFVFFSQNIAKYNNNNHDFYGVSWSLSIEEWFYLGFPVVLTCFDAILRKHMSKSKILAAVIGFYLIGFLGVRFIILLESNSPWKDTFRKAVICREDSIAYGVLVAYMQNLKPVVFTKLKNLWFAIGLTVTGLCIFYFATYVSKAYFFESEDTGGFAKTAYFSVVSLGIAFCIPWIYHMGKPVPTAQRLVTHVSKVSYSMYLTHLFALSLIFKLIGPSESPIKTLLAFLSFLIVSTIVATVSFRLIEEPFFKLRDKKWKEKYRPV